MTAHKNIIDKSAKINMNPMKNIIRNIYNNINIVIGLGKVRITLFVSFSSALGYIIAGGGFDINMLLITLGVFILSMGCSSLNQWQEIKQDSMMNRTKSRPIPKGIISSGNAFIVSLILLMIGLSLLSFTDNIFVLVLGIFSIIWYNLVYTPLKMKTSLAIMPGAIVGSIPPAIGWVAGGGIFTDPQLWALALFFFIWQIPHFWLLLMVYEEDYKRAGFPVLTEVFSLSQLRRITYVWIVALVASCMLIPLFSAGTYNFWTGLLLLSMGLLLLWRAKGLLDIYFQKKSLRFVFIDINVYVLAVAILLSFDRLILL